jgi:colicin import membrane protein|tara:strand:- start:2576 stop:3340 length:765 start_codon:yes stop_codon:yes gene_type:complete
VSTGLSYVLSSILAFCFHAVVVGLLLLNWDNKDIVESLPDQRYYIEATVVQENPYTAKEKRKQAKKAAEKKKRHIAKQRADEKARLNQEAIEKAKRQSLEKQIEEQKKHEDELVSMELSKAVDREVEFTEDERVRMEQSLTLSILEEQEYRRAVTDDEKALAYVSQIQRDIIQNWSRPPTARNGMQALLRVHLVPTGEIVNVVVEETSGNDAFDRSALLAVRKTQRFQVPAKSRQFERNFREFTVLFRPEDLRL